MLWDYVNLSSTSSVPLQKLVSFPSTWKSSYVYKTHPRYLKKYFAKFQNYNYIKLKNMNGHAFFLV